MTTIKIALLVTAIVLAAACSKRSTVSRLSAIGPNSVIITKDGQTFIYNPDNGAREQEPSREAAQQKLPWDMTREVNPPEPSIPKP